MAITISKEHQEQKEMLDNRRPDFIGLGFACYRQEPYDKKIIHLNQSDDYIKKYVAIGFMDWSYCVRFFKKLNLEIEYYLGYFYIGVNSSNPQEGTVPPMQQKIENTIPSLLSYFLLNTIESYMANKWQIVYHENHNKKIEKLIKMLCNGSIASYRRLSFFLDKDTLREISKRSVEDKEAIILEHIERKLGTPRIKKRIKKEKEESIEALIQERTKELIEQGEKKLQEIYDFEAQHLVANLSVKRTNAIIEGILK